MTTSTIDLALQALHERLERQQLLVTTLQAAEQRAIELRADANRQLDEAEVLRDALEQAIAELEVLDRPTGGDE